MAVVRKGVTLQGMFVGSREMFEEMNRAIERHGLRPVIDRAFPFADAPAAYRHFAGRRHFGKVVITDDYLSTGKRDRDREAFGGGDRPGPPAVTRPTGCPNHLDSVAGTADPRGDPVRHGRVDPAEQRLVPVGEQFHGRVDGVPGERVRLRLDILVTPSAEVDHRDFPARDERGNLHFLSPERLPALLPAVKGAQRREQCHGDQHPGARMT